MKNIAQKLQKTLACMFIFMLAIVSCGFTFKPAEKRYCDTYYTNTGTTEWVTATKTFASYTTNEFYFERCLPHYEEYVANACAPRAGTIIMGYYDYTCPELIPDYLAGYYYEGIYYYRGQSTQVDDVSDELYIQMGTNVGGSGTTRSGFLSGLNTYVTGKGYNYSYTQISTTNLINSTHSYLVLEQPVVLFVSGYRFYPYAGITIEEGSIEFYGKNSPNGHVCVAYGHIVYNFVDSLGNTTTESFMIVGFGDGYNGLLSLDVTTVVDYAYAINVTP